MQKTLENGHASIHLMVTAESRDCFQLTLCNGIVTFDERVSMMFTISHFVDAKMYHVEPHPVRWPSLLKAHKRLLAVHQNHLVGVRAFDTSSRTVLL